MEEGGRSGYTAGGTQTAGDKHLLPIPEISAEISEDQTRVREPEPENCLTCLNKEEHSSVLNNPLMKVRHQKKPNWLSGNLTL